MRLAKAAHESAAHSPLTNSLAAGPRCSRKASSLYGRRDTPTIFNSAGRRFLRSRLYSDGTSFRAVRSPEAPKITSVRGVVAIGSSRGWVVVGNALRGVPSHGTPRRAFPTRGSDSVQ